MAGTPQNSTLKPQASGAFRGYAQLGAPDPQREPFGDFDHRSAADIIRDLSIRRPIDGVVMKDGRPYRWIDNGQANALVPVATIGSTPEEAQRERSAAEVSTMLGGPLGAAGYLVASLAGASSQTRDLALAGGAAVDTLLTGAAPLGARSRNIPRGSPGAAILPEFRTQLSGDLIPKENSERPRIVSTPNGVAVAERPMGLDSQGRSKGVVVPVTEDRLGKGAPIKEYPPGHEGKGSDHDRSHLAAAVLGWGDFDWNRMTLFSHSNRGEMATFEKKTAALARLGEVFDYSITPFYSEGQIIPTSVLLNRWRTWANDRPRLVMNRPRPPSTKETGRSVESPAKAKARK